tara:strand:- start:173 stop:562 length:390 start_codon:yes stop_codon:yes gene_type:complete
MSTLSVATIKSASSAAPVFQNSSGTEKGQLAKSWINFNGTGTVAIRDSFNVSSLTDNGTGNYTVSFSTAMANTNYAPLTTGHIFDDQNPENVRDMGAIDLTTSSYRYCSGYTTGSLQDSENCFGAVFGD